MWVDQSLDNDGIVQTSDMNGRSREMFYSSKSSVFSGISRYQVSVLSRHGMILILPLTIPDGNRDYMYGTESAAQFNIRDCLQKFHSFDKIQDIPRSRFARISSFPRPIQSL